MLSEGKSGPGLAADVVRMCFWRGAKKLKVALWRNSRSCESCKWSNGTSV